MNAIRTWSGFHLEESEGSWPEGEVGGVGETAERDEENMGGEDGWNWADSSGM